MTRKPGDRFQACHHLRGRGMALAIYPGRDNPFKKNQTQFATLAIVFLVTFYGRPSEATEQVSPSSDIMNSGTALAATISDTLVIKARALADPVAPSAGGIAVRIDLEAGNGSRDLGQELSQAAGLQIRRYGGIGFAAVPAMRGAAAAQIRFFLDGMPLNSAQDGDVDLSQLPVERLAAAEIHRGAVPLGLGGMGGAGAVNLVTRDHFQGSDLSLFSGSFGDRGGRASWAGTTDDGASTLFLMAHSRRAENDFEYNDHNQTFHTVGDDTLRHRENADFKEWGFWGSGKHQAGDFKIQTGAGFFRKDGGRPGALNYPSPHAQVRSQRANFQVVTSWQEAWTLELAGAKQKQILYDPENEVEDGFGGTITSNSDDVTARLSWTHPVSSFLDLMLGGQERRSWYHQYYDDQPDPRRSRTTTSAFAGATLALFERRVTVMPGWRWQRNHDDFPVLPIFPWLPETPAEHQREDVSPSLGAMWEILPDVLFIQGHAARSVRVPTWIELFGHRGGIAGNQNLQPEEITAADIAISVKSEGSGRYLRLAAFHAETDQAIVFIQNSPGSSKAQNIGQTRTGGLELEGNWIQWWGLNFSGNLTWQKARDHGSDPIYQGNQLPFLSDLSTWLRVSRKNQVRKIWLEWAWESEKYRDRANTEINRAPTRSLFNLGVHQELPAHWINQDAEMSAGLEIINLLDDTTYDVEEFPLPGRSLQLSLRVKR